MKSLARDRNDEQVFFGGWRHQHRQTAGMMVPFFFTRETMPLPLVGALRNSTALLIGGGPSLQELNLSKAGVAWRMTLNNDPTTIRPNANCTVDDPSRFNLSVWLDPSIMKFVPMAHFEKKLWDNRRLKVNGESLQKWEPSELRVGDCPNVIGYRRNEKFHAPRWLYEDSINWGNHAKYGGGRSVMLAAMRILCGLALKFSHGVKRYDLILRNKGRKHSNIDLSNGLKFQCKTSDPLYANQLFDWIARMQKKGFKPSKLVIVCPGGTVNPGNKTNTALWNRLVRQGIQVVPVDLVR